MELSKQLKMGKSTPVRGPLGAKKSNHAPITGSTKGKGSLRDPKGSIMTKTLPAVANPDGVINRP